MIKKKTIIWFFALKFAKNIKVMKSKFIFFLFLSIVLKSLDAQFSRDNSILPSPGNTFEFVNNLNDVEYKVAPKGNNQKFDFKSISDGLASTVSYKAYSGTKFPKANMRISIGEDAPIELYLEKTQNDVIIRGLDLGDAIPLPLDLDFRFNGNLKFLTSPISYNMGPVNSQDKASITLPKDVIESLVGNLDSLIANASIPGLPPGVTPKVDSISVEVSLSCKISCDAFGKITTPTITDKDVLRLERALDFSFIPYIHIKIGPLPLKLNLNDLGLFPLPSEDLLPSVKTHSFYGSSGNQEVVLATLDSLGTNYTTIQYDKKAVMNIESISKLKDFNAFYNGSYLVLNFPDNHSYRIVDILGKEMNSRNSIEKQIDSELWSKGLYLMHFYDQNGYLTKTIKTVKQ
jgi:hypothetical protein